MNYMLENKTNSSIKWGMKITCLGVGWQKLNSACNRRLSVGAEDIRIKKHIKDGTNKKVKLFGVICPYCGCFTNIGNFNIPDQIRKIAKVL